MKTNSVSCVCERPVNGPTNLEELSLGDDQEHLLLLFVALSFLLVALLRHGLQVVQRLRGAEGEGRAAGPDEPALVHVDELVLGGAGPGQVERCSGTRGRSVSYLGQLTG